MGTDTNFLLELTCLALVLGLASCNEAAEGQLHPRCHYDTVHRLFTANCSSLDLDTVPAYLNPDIEALELSNNRIRVLHESTFAHLPKLQILYLNDNEIKSIDPLTFDQLEKLQTLDLRGNTLNSLNISYPASLKKLYLGSNNINMERQNLQQAHSLMYLSLRKATLTEIPDLGYLPNLVELDVTGNAIRNISSLQLASFCGLSLIHVDKDIDAFAVSPCDCLQFQHYAAAKGIRVENLVCSATDGTPLESCPAAEIPEEAQVRYAACQAASVTRQIPRWAMSGLLFVVFVVSIAAGIILWRRRRDNVKRKKRVGGAGDKEAKTKEPEAKTEPALLA